jgi:hypothetical protein
MAHISEFRVLLFVLLEVSMAMQIYVLQSLGEIVWYCVH